MKAHHERFRDEPARTIARRDERLGLFRVERDRLLAQHVLARLERADRPRHMQLVGQRIVDRLDLGVGQQVFVGSIGAGDAEALAAARALAGRARRSPRFPRASPRCIAGMTFSVAMLATPSTPHFTLRTSPPTMKSIFGPARARADWLALRPRDAALRLPRQHPARIFGSKRADFVERRHLLRLESGPPPRDCRRAAPRSSRR